MISYVEYMYKCTHHSVEVHFMCKHKSMGWVWYGVWLLICMYKHPLHMCMYVMLPTWLHQITVCSYNSCLHSCWIHSSLATETSLLLNSVFLSNTCKDGTYTLY